MDLETFSASPINANELVAHRGFRGKYPENTILSITKAIEAGALFVELDVQFSEDKLPIIYHDSELSRVSGEAMYHHCLHLSCDADIPLHFYRGCRKTVQDVRAIG